MMKIRPYHKLRLQIASIIIIMLAAIIVLSLFTYNSFSNVINSKNVVSFSQNAQTCLNYSESRYEVIPAQMSWISGSVNMAGYFDNESLWDRSMYSDVIKNNLQGVITTVNSVEAAIIMFSDSQVMLESHRIPERSFLRALKVIRDSGTTERNSPQTAMLDQSDASYSLVFSQTIYSYNKAEKRQSSAGTIYFFVDPMTLLPESDSSSIQNMILLFKENGNDPVILSESASMNLENTELLIETTDNASRTIKIGEENYHYFFRRIAKSNLFLLSLIPEANLQSESNKTLFVGSVLLMIVSIFAVGSIWFLSSEISHPLRRIEEGMRTIGEGNFDYRLAEKGDSELALISIGVNNLLDHLQTRSQEVAESQERLYEAKLLEKDSRIRMLQFQINPHFLYNTLECIRSIAQNYHIQELSEIVAALIGIFRYNTAGNHQISFREELVCCRYYAKIIGIRFSNKYTFDFQCAEEVLDNLILKMTLQPILENAVLHGLAMRPGPGKIILSCQKVNEIIHVSIEDNGVGITSEKMKKLEDELNSIYDISAGETIGLRNVHQRLIYEYGEKSGLSIKSEPGYYTVVSFEIPSRNGKD